MFKQLLKQVVRRVAHDAHDISRRLVAPGTGSRVATGAARALTRNWAAATVLAEAAAARWSASTPSEPAPGAPLRVLFAGRFGAMSPLAEGLALDALAALEAAQAAPRARPIELTLCGTSALSPAGTQTSAFARRILRHRVLDASLVSAADVAAWISAHDVVLTCNDFGADTTAAADLELGAMALGFARAHGLPALGLGVASSVAEFAPPARDFLRRFARKAVFGALGDGALLTLVDDGFAAMPLTREGAIRSQTSEANRAFIVLAAPNHDGGSTVVSPLAEAMRLGALLLGGGEAPRSAAPRVSAAEVADALRTHDFQVTIVRVGGSVGASDDTQADLVLDDGDAWRAWLGGLPPDARVITDAADVAADANLSGLGVVRLSAFTADHAAFVTRLKQAVSQPVAAGVNVAACVAGLLAPLSPLVATPALSAPDAEAAQ